MKQILKGLFAKLGYSIKNIDKENNPYADIKESEFWEIYNLCEPYTMTSVEPLYALYNSVGYILGNNIQGSIVICGVWRGGSAMLIAKMLSNRNIFDKKIYLFDTFEGMSAPSQHDIDFRGNHAFVLLKENENNKEKSVWCLADLADVKNNMMLTNYPEENIIYIKGKVENTIPENSPKEDISLLHLDTDWYESTKHELQFLYPKLVLNGILLIDDYGHWEGCRKAVDEYFKEQGINILLNRIDSTVRLVQKTII
ncbi:MAG: macrocin O-methyltransferase [Bacteroidetes bacterium]|nr:MAG: macrocin O-methyltransferase [Bacteroidota bacterium]